MRPSSICHLVLAILLAQGAAHAQPFATVQQLPATTPSQQPPRKSAALTHKTAYKADPFQAMRSQFLQMNSSVPIATAAELDLLNDANDGHIEHWSMAKAVLVIGGVEDPAQQQHYLAYLKLVEGQCKKAVAGTHSAKTRAEALGKFLLKGPLRSGYVSGQSDFIRTLNDGTFNCVSSAIMYNLMAPRVGIQVRVVTISGHIFSRTIDFDIEPTSGNVYPLDDRVRRSLKNQSPITGAAAPYHDQIFRETGNAGLLASVYSNNASDFLRQQQHALAVATYLKAACLDPGDPGTVYNLRLAFGKWVKACNANHDAQGADTVLKFATALLRPYEDATTKVAAK
jgi:hypothetical protein